MMDIETTVEQLDPIADNSTSNNNVDVQNGSSENYSGKTQSGETKRLVKGEISSSVETIPNPLISKQKSPRKNRGGSLDLPNTSSKGFKSRPSFMMLSPTTIMKDLIGKEPSTREARSKSKSTPRVKKDCQLTVKVFEARDLPDKKTREKMKKKEGILKTTSNFIMEVSSPNLMSIEKVAVDGYCKIAVESQQSRTRTIFKKSSPFWCEEFRFDVEKPESSVIKLSVWDYNRYDSDDPIGRIWIPISSIKDQQVYEQWIPICKLQDKNLMTNEDIKNGQKFILSQRPNDYPYLGDVRVRMKYTEEIILPASEYKDLIELLQEPTFTLAKLLGRVTSEREAVAGVLIRIFHSIGQIRSFIDELITSEIKSTLDPDIIFRGNSLATKVVDVYMKFVGIKWLDVIKPLIQRLYQNKEALEINPTKLDKQDEIKKNVKNLLKWVERFSKAIFGSIDQCPPELRLIYHNIQKQVMEAYPIDQVRITKYTAVTGFVFLRFWGPSILGPKLFGLMDEHPDISTNRTLILIAKVLQNLANLVEFAGEKEDYMTPMNDFLIPNLDNLKTFIDKLATPPPENFEPTKVPQPNIEKELGSLYRQLRKELPNMVTASKTDKERDTLEVLKMILLNLENIEQQEKLKENS